MLACAVQLARRRLVERLDHERGLAATRYAGNAGEGAERNLRRHVLQIVAARACDLEPAIVGRGPALRRYRDLLQTDEIFSRQALGRAHDVLGRALGDDVAAMDAGT